MKKELFVTLLWSVLWIVLANVQRGYFAIGGEWFAWIIPMVIFTEAKTWKAD